MIYTLDVMCRYELGIALSYIAADKVPSGISHEGYISIMVTTLGVMIGVFALMLGALACFGYRTVVDAAKKKAEQCATDVANSRVEAIARDAACEFMEKYIGDERFNERLVAAIRESKSPPGTSDSVSAPYPGEEGLHGRTDESTYTGPDHPETSD